MVIGTNTALNNQRGLCLIKETKYCNIALHVATIHSHQSKEPSSTLKYSACSPHKAVKIYRQSDCTPALAFTQSSQIHRQSDRQTVSQSPPSQHIQPHIFAEVVQRGVALGVRLALPQVQVGRAGAVASAGAGEQEEEVGEASVVGGDQALAAGVEDHVGLWGEGGMGGRTAGHVSVSRCQQVGNGSH
jgi:hypothetical protein